MYIPLNQQPNNVFTHFKTTTPTISNLVEHAKNEWSPYQNHSGTVLAIGLPGVCVVAGDTRLSVGYNIISREATKLQKLTDKCILATSGMYADFIALKKQLQANLQHYEFQNDKQAPTETVAHLLSRKLYQRRTFPFYTFNLLAGLDSNGVGKVYGYDAIGSYDAMQYGVQGSGQELIVSVLDNQLTGYNKKVKSVPTTKEQVLELVIDCFNVAAERDIATGDSVEIVVITEQGMERIVRDLRKD